MKVLQTHIRITDRANRSIEFDWVNEIEIESSWKELTDKARIVLPANVKVDKHLLSEHIAIGDEIEIQLGYQGSLFTAFTGYLSEIKPATPIEIVAEDAMWLLKQSHIQETLKNTDLNALAKKYFLEFRPVTEDIRLGNYTIDNISKAKLLHKLKEDIGLAAFFRNNRLYLGKQYASETMKTHIFRVDHNIISDELIFRYKDEAKIKVQANNHKTSGEVESIELGDASGESRNVDFYNLQNTKELKEHAQRALDKLSYDGWRGSFTAFGQPFVRHGDLVELAHENESQKTGIYWVDAVTYTFGTSGFRQKISLGQRKA